MLEQPDLPRWALLKGYGVCHGSFNDESETTIFLNQFVILLKFPSLKTVQKSVNRDFHSTFLSFITVCGAETVKVVYY